MGTPYIHHNAGPKRSSLGPRSLRFGETPGNFLRLKPPGKDRAQMAPLSLFSFFFLLVRARLCMIHGNPSNSTPIFLSARATPDGKLAYDPFYQVCNPSMVTLSRNELQRESRGPHVGCAGVNISCLVQNLERFRNHLGLRLPPALRRLPYSRMAI